jgi:multicomponent Na+:H+ antiporter subunit B
MIKRYPSIVIETVCRGMVPLIQLFALYVMTHGHSGPGGGFQGGVILAASFILMRLVLGGEIAHGRLSPELALVVGTAGILLYGVIGAVPMLGGGQFLDYGQLPVPGISGAALRSLGILVVEIGIGLAVCGVIVTIFDNLAGRQG